MKQIETKRDTIKYDVTLQIKQNAKKKNDTKYEYTNKNC